LLSALAAAEGVMTNRVQRAAASAAADQVRDGMGLSRALAMTRQFPPILIHLTASGEATGRLDRMLERAAQELSRELSRRIETFTTLLGPAVVLIMGAVVLFIVLAILLPVFEINQFVK
jgi:general secretion pathway protein F